MSSDPRELTPGERTAFEASFSEIYGQLFDPETTNEDWKVAHEAGELLWQVARASSPAPDEGLQLRADLAQLSAVLVDLLDRAVISGHRERDRIGRLPALRRGVEIGEAVASSPVPEGQHNGIPDSYWREVPCGHPNDPVAVRAADGRPVCHCGKGLDIERAIDAPYEAPGPVVHCEKCGCYIAIPPVAAPVSVGDEDKERVEQ